MYDEGDGAADDTVKVLPDQFPPIEGNPSDGPGWVAVLVIIVLFALAAWSLT